MRVEVEKINALEAEMKDYTTDGLKERGLILREKIKSGELTLDEALPKAYALVRETAKRLLKQRHFDVQLMGGVALHQGSIVEMRTGEGKTLTATAPVYLNALTGKGAHVVTVNEYLAKRDAVWMGQIYDALGLKVACLAHEGAFVYDPGYKPAMPEVKNQKDQPLAEGALIDKERDTTGGFMVQQEFLKPINRQQAYLADITYGTNHEFGFDYLRDNLAYNLGQQVQRGHHFAIVDEVDSILIDEARTPLIIAAPDSASSDSYKTFTKIASRLEKDVDYTVDEKLHSVEITQEGIDKVEKALNLKNIFAAENLRLTHYLQESLKAKALFLKDRDYVVKNNEVIIVDQFTGRMMLGRRYSGGLHQAIEAKEGVFVQQESKTYAQISIQNYFRLYEKLAGMTGTAQTSAEEFDKVYDLEVVTIPTNQEMVRNDQADLVFKNGDGKHEAITRDIKERNAKGQPILIGTVSIEKNEELSRRLAKAGIRHEILNAKNHEREGAIIAQAGRLGAVTVATNMAGRGVDIILGGNPPSITEAQKIKDLGGLHVVGTERHESRRIDNQLRGRAGRQGDPGSSQFFLSLEDDLMRVFGGGRIKGLMETLKIPDDQPIQSGLVSRAISQAQGKVEGMNFDARKHLLEYDDVLNKQRLKIYQQRQAILVTKNLELRTKKQNEDLEEVIEEKSMALSPAASNMVLSMLDMLWLNHLENMEALTESIRLRAYGQHDPLVEYRREAYLLFQQLQQEFEAWVVANEEKLKTNNQEQKTGSQQIMPEIKIDSPVVKDANGSVLTDGKIGRNDPCYCGSGKKYKKCHGK